MKKIKFLILLLFMCICFSFKTYSDEVDFGENDILLEYSYGYDGIAKLGRYLPINLGINNIKDAGFKGFLSFKLIGGDGKRYEYQYPVELKEKESVVNNYYIPLGNKSDKIEIILEDENQKEILKRNIELDIDKNHSKLMVGVLSDTPDKLNYLENASINYGLLTSKFINLSQYTFPDTQTGLDQLDIILISNFRIRDLSYYQSRALMDWVKSGGVMILGTGKRVDDTLGRFAPELLENMYTDPVSREIYPGGFSEGNAILQNDQVQEIPTVDVDLHGGNIISSMDNLILISEVNKERGIIAVAAYDFCDISAYAQTHNAYVDSMLGSILGATRINSIAYEMYNDDSITYSDMQEIVNTTGSEIIPPISELYIVLFIYLIAVGPFCYNFLKRRNATSYYRRIVVLFSVIFSAIVYLMGSTTRFTEVFYNYATILDVSEENVYEKTFFSIRSPYNKPYNALVSSNYSILPITGTSTDTVSGGKNKKESDVKITFNENDTNVNVSYIGAFKPVFFELERNIENKQKAGFTGNFTLFEDNITGEVTNNFGYKVINASLLLYGKVVLLGDFEAGESKKIDNYKVYDIPITNFALTAGKITGRSSYKITNIYNSEYVKALKRTNLLTSYMNYYMSGYTVDAKMVAFSQNPVSNDILVEDKFESSGISLMSSSMVINNTSNNLVYKNVLMKNPRVISGEYYKETNYIYSNEPAVLEYFLGNEIDVEELIFNRISKDFFDVDTYNSLVEFDGNVSFYNQETGEYDLVDISKRKFTKEELSQYISNKNTIIIRYSNSADSGSVILPMIFVVGKAR